MVDHLELADRLGRQLFRLVRAVDRRRAQVAAQRGDTIERASFGLLIELADRGPRRLTALADAVFADPSTVSRQVGQLVQHGYVVREPDPQDGRACRLAATGLGRAHVAEVRRRRNDFLAGVLAGWPQADREQLVRLLGRLNDDLDRALNAGQPLLGQEVS